MFNECYSTIYTCDALYKTHILEANMNGANRNRSHLEINVHADIGIDLRTKRLFMLTECNSVCI